MPLPKLRVVLADEHPVMREGLRAAFEHAEDREHGFDSIKTRRALEHAVKKWNPVFHKKACDNNKIRA
jgi:DNA-binding NarL/FixJ family response regulator